MKRHFIVFYTAKTESKSIIGNAFVLTEDGSYINSSITLRQISENLKIDKKYIAFTNIIELSESDFKNFTEDEDGD